MASEFGKYVFYKDITPAFLDSDRSGGNGFTDTSRLETLLKDWGFSDVDVKKVTMWKISSRDQYVEDGPRLEWKGNIYVTGPEHLKAIKWKNKAKSSYQATYIDNGKFYLNDGASSYSTSDYKYIHISEIGFGMPNNRCFIWKNENGSEWTVDKSPLDYEYTEWSINDSNEVKNKGKTISFNTDVIQDLNGNEVLTEHLEKFASKIKINDGYRINNDRTLEIVAFNENTSKTKQDGQFIFSQNKKQTYGTESNNAAPCFGAEPAVYPVVLFNNLEDTKLNDLIEVSYNISGDDTIKVNDKLFPFDFKNDLLVLYRRTQYKLDSRTELKKFPETWKFQYTSDGGLGNENNEIFQLQSFPDSEVVYSPVCDIETNYLIKGFEEDKREGNTYTEKTPPTGSLSPLTTDREKDFFNKIVGSRNYETTVSLPPIAAIDWYLPENAFKNNKFISLGSFLIETRKGGDPEGYFVEGGYLSGEIKIKIKNFQYLKDQEFFVHENKNREKWAGTEGEKLKADTFNYGYGFTAVPGINADADFIYHLEFFSPPGLIPSIISPYEPLSKKKDNDGTYVVDWSIDWSIEANSIYLYNRSFGYTISGSMEIEQEPHGGETVWKSHYRKYGFAIVRWVNGKRFLGIFKKNYVGDEVKIIVYNPFSEQLSYKIGTKEFKLDKNKTQEHTLTYDEWMENGLDYQCIENSSWIHFSDEDVPFEEDIPFETNTFTITKSTLTSSGVKFFLSNNIKNNIEVNFFDGASWRKITVAANSEITCQAPVSTYSSTKFTYKDPNTGVNIELLYNDIPLKAQ